MTEIEIHLGLDYKHEFYYAALFYFDTQRNWKI